MIVRYDTTHTSFLLDLCVYHLFDGRHNKWKTISACRAVLYDKTYTLEAGVSHARDIWCRDYGRK